MIAVAATIDTLESDRSMWKRAFQAAFAVADARAMAEAENEIKAIDAQIREQMKEKGLEL